LDEVVALATPNCPGQALHVQAHGKKATMYSLSAT